MIQVVEMTQDEKVKMYRALPKEKLIEMLIAANDAISVITPQASFGFPDERVKCDSCGCHPSSIIQTQFGQFCPQHAKYV